MIGTPEIELKRLTLFVAAMVELEKYRVQGVPDRAYYVPGKEYSNIILIIYSLIN